MSKTATYQTRVVWKGDHRGRVEMGNGQEMDFSAPPDAQGYSGVLTPEDAFVAAVNTCIMMMFLWSCERLKIKLLAYECQAEGTKVIEIDHTEIFSYIKLFPEIKVLADDGAGVNIEKRIHRALKAAQKYSLVANSIKSEVIIEPTIEVVEPAKSN
jgi:organic hydroperoxide reductase OsmC/OhrA